MNFYSRSSNSEGTRETIKQHIEKVGLYAKANAFHFSKEQEGEIVGLFHDFGKYGRRFQQVLTGEASKINHEYAGSVLISKLFRQDTKELQVVVSAHHKGLDFHNTVDMKTYLDPDFNDSFGRQMSISSLEEFQHAVKHFNEEVGFGSYSIKRNVFSVCKNPNIERMLYIRMLLSCLVDADYTASAEHYDRNYGSHSSGAMLDTDTYLKQLLAFRDQIRKSSTSNSEINHIRDTVFDECLSAAIWEPGLFTLTAPTGTGKTLALLAFALKHAQVWKKRRVIIILPFLSIIEQNAAQYVNICPNLLEDHSQSTFTETTRLFSDRWSAGVIVTTSVKFFEGLFQDKPTDCRRLHNISDSVIVFDEAQSLPHGLLGSTIETVNALCQSYNCTVLFSTATQPDLRFREDLVWNPREVISDVDAIFQATKRVEVDWRLTQKSSFQLLAGEVSQFPSCCIILNMKRHTVALYRLLKQILGEDDSLFHISTDMCVAHRKKVINMIKERLIQGLPCRLVSTQCIEAGVDLDFDRVYRALAPLDAIIQSAGRCNRNGRLTCGKVVVFVPEEEAYPDDYYKNAANRVRLLSKEFTIDISNTEHVKKYYSYLYKEYNKDKPALTEAINNLDFDEVSKQYKLITNAGHNVIVPFDDEMGLFEEIASSARAHGLTPPLIEKARPISVTSYARNIQDVAEQLYFQTKHGRDKTNWYLLLDRRFYSEKTGLQIENDASLNTAF